MITNRNIIKRTEVKKSFKQATPDLSFAAALSGDQNENKIPGTSAPPKKPLEPTKIIATKITLDSMTRSSSLEYSSLITPFSWKWEDSSEMQKTTRRLIFFIKTSLTVTTERPKIRLRAQQAKYFSKLLKYFPSTVRVRLCFFSLPTPSFFRATRPPNGRRAARPMERFPLPPQIAFLPCTSQSQDKSKARSPIGRETSGHWSNESLRMILGRFDDPANLSNPVRIFSTLNCLTRAKPFNVIYLNFVCNRSCRNNCIRQLQTIEVPSSFKYRPGLTAQKIKLLQYPHLREQQVINKHQQVINKLHNIHPSTAHYAAVPVRRHDIRLTRLRIGHTRLTHRHLLLGESPPA
ncbi:hypothetical protein TNCV_1676251 [Trichonephila clavipes]|nr:hypothetical protein TNCV_1676251 [Trichonephila clavipes]